MKDENKTAAKEETAPSAAQAELPRDAVLEKYKDKIKEWKHVHGDVYSIRVGDKVCFLKRPCRKTLSYAGAVGAKDPIKFNEIMLANCWLGGDENIKTDDVLFLSVSQKLAELIQIKEAELVKL